MKKSLVSEDILFEVIDVLGKRIRTTKSYWKKIKEIKHPELKAGVSEIKETLTNPDEVRKSVSDQTVQLYIKRIENYDIIIVPVKILNGDGFLVTTYQTKRHKKKGKLLWPK